MGVTLEHESALWRTGARIVAGIDEVGRGALAGPVSVGVVAVAPCETWPDGLADSKALAPEARETLAERLAAFGVARAVGSASNGEIDSFGIVAALRLAGLRALAAVAEAGVAPDVVLLDGTHDWLSAPPATLFGEAAIPEPTTDAYAPRRVVTVVRGDACCASIAAASILAKVDRDARMREAGERHPAYGWGENKGYGTSDHLAALERHGPSPLHRVSWKIPGGRGSNAVGGMMGT